ncbi:hypothetical protein [Haloechinothrix halophila]|uniref:hypothetical protein n=1 Tax=Haloechinothrix halophila TaxID=1069073 RepID=UPI00041A0986|nr:hypothetical protein [Haloechinothrix halophila]
MRLSKIVAPVAIALLIGGSAGIAAAQPGPNGSNNFGLCTAYFAGSDKGKEKKRQAPPFQALEAAAEESDQTVEEWCAQNAPHPSGNGGGNGGNGGRP